MRLGIVPHGIPRRHGLLRHAKLTAMYATSRSGSIRRPRWRSYLLLSRISNLPTVGTNVLAGIVGSSANVDWPGYLWLSLVVSLFYTGGMFLNDAFDEPFDRKRRPERPIPRGDVSRAEVFVVGGLFLLTGELLLVTRSAALLFGVVLATAIVIYDYSHKNNPIAPLIMGACRGFVYCLAAAASGGLTVAVVVGAGVVTAYVAGLTVVAKLAGPNARWLIPVLIAGISVVDAIFIAIVTSSPLLSLAAAACGFGLTLFLQRFVPGD
jgi:MFS family permease